MTKFHLSFEMFYSSQISKFLESHSVFSIIGIGYTFVAFFVSIFFLLKKKFSNDGYFWLYVIILLLAFELGHKTLIESKLYDQFIFLYAPGRYYNLLLYPCLLFFVWSLLEYNPLEKHWKLLILFLFSFTGLKRLWQIVFLTLNEKSMLLEKFYEDTRPGPFNYWQNTSSLLQSTLIPAIMLLLTLYFFWKQHSLIERKVNKRLVFILLLTLSIYFIFGSLSNLFYKFFFKRTNVSFIEWPIDIIFISSIICLFCCTALAVNSGTVFLPPLKYASSPLNQTKYAELLNNVVCLIENEKLYLDPKLTIKKISTKLLINSKYISQTINQNMGISFSEFVNQYRVQEAKRIIIKTNARHLTLEAIGKQSGFHSKSSFIQAFKKHIGKTPSQYLKERMNS